LSVRFGFAGEGVRGKPPFPWFLIGFLALAGFNSFVVIPHDVIEPIKTVTAFLLSMAMAAMGLHTNLRHVLSAGIRPLALGLFASLFISLFVLIMVRMTI